MAGCHRYRATDTELKTVHIYLFLKTLCVDIAVDTVKDERTTPQAKKAVMIWDTQAETLVGNNVYDVQAPPPLGAAAKFDTYSAEYVGSGG